MKVLLGVGGTDDSFDALEETVARATAAGDDLTVAVLANPESEMAPVEVERRVREAVDAAGLGTDVRRLAGDPGPALVELADAEDFDMLVLGGGERSPMGKIQVGHVAEFVVLNARTTVKLVR